MIDALERPALYYPHIHIRNEHWLKATLLCFPCVKRIVPDNYIPEDQPNIIQYTKIEGPNGPLLQAVPSNSPAPFGTQERLLNRLQEHRDEIHKRYRRGRAPKPDKYWVHTAKFAERLLDFLLQNQLAWPSPHSHAYGHRTWYALHPVLGSAVMTTLGLSIAREQTYDIVTPSNVFHEALLANREDAILDALLRDGDPQAGPAATQATHELTQLVVSWALNLQALPAEDIPALHDSAHFRKFQRLIRRVAQRIDREAEEERYHAQLKEEAEEIIESWQDSRKELGKNIRHALFGVAALTANALRFAKRKDFTGLATIGPLAIGTVRSGKAAIENLRGGGPYHYLSQLKSAESKFLRMTFPLGLER